MPEPKFRPLPKAAGCLRVVTLNVHFGQKVMEITEAFKSNSNLAAADIILLQEIEAHERERFSRASRIAKGLGFGYVYAPARKLVLQKASHGLAILSRLPFAEVEIIQLPYFELPLRHRPRIALKAQLQLGKKHLLVYNVHLDATINHRERLAQLQAVLNHMDRLREIPVILGGDFNTIPLLMLGRAVPVFYSNQKKKLKTFLRRRGFETRCQAVGHTLKRGMARFQLDGIYTKELPVAQFAVERTVKISDHFPLWADIKVI